MRHFKVEVDMERNQGSVLFVNKWPLTVINNNAFIDKNYFWTCVLGISRNAQDTCPKTTLVYNWIYIIWLHILLFQV